MVNKLFLWNKIYLMRMNDGDLVIENLNAFNNVISQLFSMDIKVLEEEKCISMLCSFPDSWDGLVVAIGSNLATLSFEYVVASLFSEEMRRKNMEGSTKDELLVRVGRIVDKSKEKSFRGRSRGRSKSLGNSIRKCWKCGKDVHFKKDCKVNLVGKRKGSDESHLTEGRSTGDDRGDV